MDASHGYPAHRDPSTILLTCEICDRGVCASDDAMEWNGSEAHTACLLEGGHLADRICTACSKLQPHAIESEDGACEACIEKREAEAASEAVAVLAVAVAPRVEYGRVGGMVCTRVFLPNGNVRMWPRKIAAAKAIALAVAS